MNALKLMLAEIQFRPLHFLMSLFAVTVAVTLFVAGPVLVEGYGKQTESQLAAMEAETIRVMRDMGFNLMIVHRDTNMADFWAEDFATADMPQDYVDRLASTPELSLVTHLVATFQQRIEWDRRKVLLVGYLPESTQSHRRKKPPMGYRIEPGTLYLGHELGIDHKAGDTVDVLGKEFTVARILEEQGSKEDITIAMHLTDVQSLVDKPGRINQILALGCHCADSELPKIRQQLEEILPETRISEFRSIALGRAEQRDLVSAARAKVRQTIETLASVLTPVVVLATAIWIGLLALANVRERRTEIGLLRALGKGSGTIGSLLLGKAVLLGLLGGILGIGAGTLLASLLGVVVLEVAPSQFAPSLVLLAVALIGAPILSALASYLPTVVALSQDPASVLRDGER